MADVDLTYNVGTASVAADGTIVTLTGAILADINIRQWDAICIDPANSNVLVPITHVNVALAQLTIPEWNGGAKTNVPYVVYQLSPLRYVGAKSLADVDAMLAALNTEGWYRYINPAYADPTAAGLVANEGQFAFKYTTGQLWIMSGGTWQYVGVFKGLSPKGNWNNATAYVANDVVSYNGSSYIAAQSGTNHLPTNAAYWQILASKGDTGPASLKPLVAWATATAYAPGPPADYVTINGSSYACAVAHTSAAAFATDLAAGRWIAVALKGADAPVYGGVSTSSLTLGVGTKAFVTQTNLAWQNGARIRAASMSDISKWMEGSVAYSNGSSALTMSVDKFNGTGTVNDWVFNPAGQPGAGDVSSVNVGTEYSGKGGLFIKNIGFDVRPKLHWYDAQSNGENSFSDTGLVAPPNLLVWTVVTPGGDGTATFLPAQKITYWFQEDAIRRALEEPFRMHYAVCCAKGSQPVQQWVSGSQLTGGSYVDMYSAKVARINAVFAYFSANNIAITQINNKSQWIGESNAYLATDPVLFKGYWDQLQAYWRSQSWFAYNTQVYCMGYNPFSDSGQLIPYSRLMREWCEADMGTRCFVDTSKLLSGTHWMTTEPHMTQAGYRLAGAMLFEAKQGHLTRSPFITNDRKGTWTPTTGSTSGQAITTNYNTRVANWERFGDMLYYDFYLAIVMNLNSITGSFKINGLPFLISNGGHGTGRFSGITISGASQLVYVPLNGDTTDRGGTFEYSKFDGSASNTMAIANLPTGANNGNPVMLAFSGWCKAAANT